MMLKDPIVMLADEPTGALDPKTGQMIIQSLFDLVDENKVLILATHDMAIANQCDEIIDLEQYSKVASMWYPKIKLKANQWEMLTSTLRLIGFYNVLLSYESNNGKLKKAI